MVERYSRKEMSDNWTLKAKYDSWLLLEKSVVKAWNKLGLIPDLAKDKILEKASFNIDRINEIEKETKHDVIAFLTSVSESLGEESRWVHYGLTSSDCIDTAQALQIKRSLELIIKDIEKLLLSLKNKAKEHKYTLTVGRSHGIHGETYYFWFGISYLV